jgi:carboxylesterase
VADIENSQSFLFAGGKVGVLMIHGFTGSPATVEPWARGLAADGYTVSVPRLAGHGTRWEDLNETRWQDWYQSVEAAFLELRERCDRIFVAGFSVGGALALKLAQIRGSEIEGVLLLNPSDLRRTEDLSPLANREASHSVTEEWRHGCQ